MKTALSLILVGLLSRWLPHPPNAVALGAVALYAGARLPRRWAVLVPLAILFLSDLVLDQLHGYPFDYASRLTTYVTFAVIALAGGLLPASAGALARGSASVLASSAFFLASNLAVWAEGSGLSLPHTLGGLLSCYAAALPFYLNSLGADLVGTGFLFGLDAALSRTKRPESVAAGVEG